MENIGFREFPTAGNFNGGEKCNECDGENIIEDTKSGDMICTDCGVVLHGHLVDFSSEWRGFSENHGNADPSRIGAPVNPLLDSRLGTILSKGLKGSNFLNERLIRTQNQSAMQKIDRFLFTSFSKISLILEKAFLSKNIKEKTEELFKIYFDHLTLKSDGSRKKFSLRKSETKSTIAAVIFLVCRNESIPRSFKEISEISKVSKKDIGIRVRAIERSLRGVKILKNRNTDDFIKRFCNKLGLPDTSSQLAEKIAILVRERDGLYGRNYISVASAAIYIVSQLSTSNFDIGINDISLVSGTSEITIRSAYKAMFPYKNEIINYLIQKNIKINPNYDFQRIKTKEWL
jgi:transcription initiation factor TFIIB